MVVIYLNILLLKDILGQISYQFVYEFETPGVKCQLTIFHSIWRSN